VLANDSDPDQDQLTLIAVQASAGKANIAGNKIAYTPPDAFRGEATLTYTVRDQGGNQRNATVRVLVWSLLYFPSVSK
jgi:hypothetical protein